MLALSSGSMMMENKGRLTKSLAVIGVVLVWFPFLAMALTARIGMPEGRGLQVDYLIPAELFPFVLIGCGSLAWAALPARSRRGLTAWGVAIAVVALVGGQLLAMLTGLDSGETEPTGVWFDLVVASLAIYTLALVEVGAAGILLVRDVFNGPIGNRDAEAPST